MAILSREHGFLFVQVPRTGCTAVAEKVLIPELGGVELPAADVVDADGRVLVAHKHASLVKLLEHGVLTDDERRGLFVFATVRNPFDSVVSQYAKMRRANVKAIDDPDSWAHDDPRVHRSVASARERTFDDWVAWQYGSTPSWKRRARRLLRRPPGLPMYYRGVDHVMRFEHLQDDFDTVADRLGLGRRYEIPTHNRTHGRDDDYRAMYSPRSRAIVAHAFEGVLHHFDYRF